MTKAFITGISGQDGFYLATLLLSKGYEVTGLLRPSSVKRSYIAGVQYHVGDIQDARFVRQTILGTMPDEIYHLAGQSHVGMSFDNPWYTAQVNVEGTRNVLEAASAIIKVRMYNACSSEIFGNCVTPISEITIPTPVSPYGLSKLTAKQLCTQYRDQRFLYVVNGLLFNHESPRRGDNFVTQKICKGVDAIVSGREKLLKLGNLSAIRDWGYAPEYVEAMWLMLQQPIPTDYVIGTGHGMSVAQWLYECFWYVGINHYQEFLGQSSQDIREQDIDVLIADPTRAKEELGWTAQTKGKDLVKIMMDSLHGGS